MDLNSLRDIALIVLAFEGFLIGLIFLALAYGLMWLTRKLRRWLGENIEKGTEALRKFRAKVESISASITEPVIKIESSIAAVKGVFVHFRSVRKSR